MTVGMFAASQAHSLLALALARLLTGLGIGGMLSSTSAIVAETSNAQRRSLNLSLNIAGYAAGAILGGMVATMILARAGNWRAVFHFGFIATFAAVPLTFLALRESIGFLLSVRPRNALERINRVLRSYAREPLAQLPPPRPRGFRQRRSARCSPPRFRSATILLTIAYFAQIMVFYFIQKWVPKLMVDMGQFDCRGRKGASTRQRGLPGRSAGSWPAVSNGSGSFRCCWASMGCAFLCVCGHWCGPMELERDGWHLRLRGLLRQRRRGRSVIPVMAQSFPAEVRASGIGFAIGVGRGGAALGPMAAGALLSLGYPLGFVAPVMGLWGAAGRAHADTADAHVDVPRRRHPSWSVLMGMRRTKSRPMSLAGLGIRYCVDGARSLERMEKWNSVQGIAVCLSSIADRWTRRPTAYNHFSKKRGRKCDTAA